MTTQPAAPIVTTPRAFDDALDAADGIIRLAPTWVPRSFCTPGRRLKLHPADYFPFAEGRGGVDERWLSSTVRADNGPRTGPYEGISMAVAPDGTLLPFDEFVAHHGSQLIGDRLWSAYGGWPMYSKFFDNLYALPLHVHHQDHHAALVRKKGKPEAYYFAPQMNNYLGEMPFSFFGLSPETTKAEFAAKIARFAAGGDNGITELSRGYRIRPGTGWDIPAGVVHAPASACTYEPQAASDVFAMCESWSNSREVPSELLWKDVPANRVGDVDFIVELLDWDKNVDPEFLTSRMMVPVETKRSVAAGGQWIERWIVYRADAFSAKELTVEPGQTVVVSDEDAYGCIVVQGHGALNAHPVSAPTMIRYGQLTDDEFFVSESAARAGVTIRNGSTTDQLVVLKHFGPANRELVADASWIRERNPAPREG